MRIREYSLPIAFLVCKPCGTSLAGWGFRAAIASGIAIYRDTADVGLRTYGFWQRDGQDAVLERG